MTWGYPYGSPQEEVCEVQETWLTMVWARVGLRPPQTPTMQGFACVDCRGGGRGVGRMPHRNIMEPEVNHPG